jgi:hypothetical protein
MRARSTRPAGSVRDLAIARNCDKSSSPIVNSNACRHAAMIFDLVQRIKEQGYNGPTHQRIPWKPVQTISFMESLH